jgi:TonB family protein
VTTHDGPAMETTTDVLRARAQQREPLGRPYTFSLVGHAALVALIMFWPAGFLSSPEGEELRDVMTISLGGPAGPSLGGQTALAARPVQEVLPLEEANQPEWIQPPAPAPPEMTVPTPEARRRPEADVPVEAAPDESRGRTPTRGPELREGTALAETGAQGGGLGLSAGGLGSGGYLEVGDFCCPEYLGTMLQLIQQNWNARQRFPGDVMMKFTIQRDGRITDVLRETTSGYLALDQGAERALLLTDRLPPLPNRFDQDYLNVHLNFQYQP